MKKNPYLFSFWILILGALVLSGLITIGTSATTLNTETLEIVTKKNHQLKGIREKKETFFTDFRLKEIAFNNYKEAWRKELKDFTTLAQVKLQLNRLAAESNLMLKENLSAEGTLALEVMGETIPLIEWLTQVETEFFTLKIIEAHLRSDFSGMLTAVLVLKYFNAFES